MKRRKARGFLLAGALFLFVSPVPSRAGEKIKLRTYRLQKTAQAPVLDGRWDDSCWQGSKWSEPFLVKDRMQTAVPETRFKAVYDKANLYLAVQCREPDMDDLKGGPAPKDRGKLWTQDSIEIFIGPHNSAANHLQFIVNSFGAQYDALWTETGKKHHGNWNANWEAAVGKSKSGWAVEVKIPFKELLLTKKTGALWFFNITRNWPHQTRGAGATGRSRHQTWSFLKGGFNNPRYFGRLVGLKADFTPHLNLDGFKRWKLEQSASATFFYFPHPKIYVIRDVALPNFFRFHEVRPQFIGWEQGQHDYDNNPKYREYIDDFRFCLKLPEGVGLYHDKEVGWHGALFHIEQEEGVYRLLPFYDSRRLAGSGVRIADIPVYLKTSLPAGTRRKLTYWLEYGKGKKKISPHTVDLEVAELPERLPSLRRLLVAMTYMRAMDAAYWPNCIATMKRLGYTAFAPHSEDFIGENSPVGEVPAAIVRRTARELLAQARRAGLPIVMCDLGFMRYHQTDAGKEARWPGTNLPSPLYTGKRYWEELALTTQICKLMNPAYVLVRTGHFGKIASDRKVYGRNKEFMKEVAELGTHPREVFVRAGARMMQDYKNAVTKAAQETRSERPRIGRIGAQGGGRRRGSLFAIQELFPDYVDLCVPSLTHGDAAKVGDGVRQSWGKLLSRNIFPLLSTGGGDEYSRECVRDSILEAFLNGARGLWYGQFQHNDTGDYLYQLRALIEIMPVEEIIYAGAPTEETVQPNRQMRFAGLRHNDEAVVLLSCYKSKASRQGVILNPVMKPVKIFDLSAGKSLGKLKAGGVLKIELGARNTKLIYFGQRDIQALDFPYGK